MRPARDHSQAGEEPERRFREIAETIREVFWTADPGLTRVLYVSPAYEVIWGRPARELYREPKSLLETIHPEDRARVLAGLFALRRGEETTREFRILRPDGEVRWVWTRGYPLRDESGRVDRIVGIAEDITERKEREEATRFLSEASRLLATSLDVRETLARIARLAVREVADWCAVDMLEDGEIHRLEVAHVDPAKVELARELARRYPPDPDAPTGVALVLRTGKPELIPEISEAMLREVARDEEHFRILREIGLRSAMIVPMVARGRMLGAITLIAAESGRKYDEEDLAFAEELAARAAVAIDNARLYQEAEAARARVTAILESITDAFFALDHEWRFTYLNRGAREAVRRILRRDPGEVVGQRLWDVAPQFRGTRFEEEYRRAMTRQEPAHFEERVPETGIWFEVHAYPSAEGLSVYFRDVTERKRAEAELRLAHARFRRLVDSNIVGVAIADPDGTVVEANDYYLGLLGYSREELGEGSIRWTERTPPEFLPADREAIAELEARGVYAPYEKQYFRKDGSRVWVLLAGAKLPGGDGQILVLALDIDERKHTEEGLRLLAEAGATLAASLDYRQTLETVARLVVASPLADYCAIDVVEEDGELHRAATAHSDPAKQPLLEEVRRFPPGPESPLGRPLRTGRPVLLPAVTDADVEAIVRSEEHRRLVEQLGPRSIMSLPLIARGRVLGVMQLVAAESGRRYGPDDLALAERLAERAALAVDNARLFEEAEEARGEAERRAREELALRKAIEAVSESFTVHEVIRQIAESAVQATNADGTAVERVHIDRGEVEVVAVAGMLTLPLGRRLAYAGSLARHVIERGKPELIPRLGAARQPVPRHWIETCADCSALVLPLLNAGEAIGALILLRRPEKMVFREDEIERALAFAHLASLAFRKVQLLEESEKGREELLAVMESRARLIRGFSHDVKNPLGAADGYLQLLEMGVADGLTEKQLRSVERARNAIASALHLIEDLLELARAEAREIEVEREPVDVRSVVAEMAEEYRARAAAEGLTLQVELPDELPILESDATRIRQILGNLLSNAVTYTEEGGITLRVEVREDGKAPRPGRWIAVDVVDTGPGIPPEQQHLLFQEFKRIEPGAERGAGLGLAISKRIAQVLGGDITVESEVGRGSTFTLWLPVR